MTNKIYTYIYIYCIKKKDELGVGIICLIDVCMLKCSHTNNTTHTYTHKKIIWYITQISLISQLNVCTYCSTVQRIIYIYMYLKMLAK